MCGIGGIIGKETNVSELETILAPIKERGEQSGYFENYINSNIIIGTNRLKIVDRENAKQPVNNEDGSIITVMNGEIWNYKELKLELIKKGHIFSTESDTEILVHGYETWGKNLPKKLEGQFAFLVYDKNSNNFLAARDHFGIKPFCYTIDDSVLSFGSEFKQLIDQGNQIKNLFPGHLLTQEGINQYYKLPIFNNKNSFKDAITNIKSLFEESVKKRIQTDLPIAVMLSGGIDSSAVLATAVKYHSDVTALILGRDWVSEDSDYHNAMKFARELGVKIVEAQVPSEKELFEMVPNFIYRAESFEPNMIKQFGCTYYLSKMAKEAGFKVVLSGEGADEVFAGYPELAKSDNIKETSINFFKDLHQTQIQRNDRAGGSHSIEIRFPFLDRKLVEYSINLPDNYKVKNKITKYVLREVMNDLLPDYIRNRKKVVMSEGMGLKGNSLTDGLFTKLTTKEVTDTEFKFYANKFREYNFSTKEEVYYYKIFQKFAYDLIEFKSRTYTNRTHTVVK